MQSKYRKSAITSTGCRATKCDYEYRISGSSPSSAAPCGAKWLHRKEGGWIRMVWLPAIGMVFYHWYGCLLLVWLSSIDLVLYHFHCFAQFVMDLYYWFGCVPLIWFCVLLCTLHKVLEERSEAALQSFSIFRHHFCCRMKAVKVYEMITYK